MQPQAQIETNLSEDEAIHWLALRMMPGMGTKTAGRVLAVFKTPQAIFRASVTALPEWMVHRSTMPPYVTCATLWVLSPMSRKLSVLMAQVSFSTTRSLGLKLIR